MKVIIFSLLLLIFFNGSETALGQKMYQPERYCNLFDSSKQFENMPVKTTAYLTYSTVPGVYGGDSFFYFPDCNNADYFAIPNFSNINDSEKWNEFFQKLPKEKDFIFVVNFTGKLRTSVIPSFGNLGWSRAEIEILQIDSIQDITFSDKMSPDYKAESPLISKAKNLQTVNDKIMFYWIGIRKWSFEVEEYLAGDFRAKSENVVIANKQNYKSLLEQSFFDGFKDNNAIKVKIDSVEKNENIYTVKGKMTADKNKTLKYENRYILGNENWLLKETEFFTNQN